MPDASQITVKMPDGKMWDIPAANLEKAKARGAVVVEPPGAVRRYTSSLRSSMGFPEEGTAGSDIRQIGQGLKMEFTHPIESGKALLEGLGSAQQDVIDKAYQDQQSPDPMIKARGLIRGIYASLAGVGPLLNKAGEEFSSGNFAGGVGSMTPLMLGEAVKAPIVGRVAEKIPLPSELTNIRKTAQEAVVGRSEVEQARTEYNENLRKLEEDYNKKVQETGAKNTADEAAHQLKRQQIKDAYAQKLSEYRAKLTESSAKQSAAEAKSKTFIQPRGGPVYQRLSGMADKAATEDIPQLDKDVRTAYDNRWAAWRQAMGDAQGDFSSVQKAVGEAETDILKGSPENIAIFRNILAEGEDPLLSQASVFRSKGAGLDVKELLGSKFMSEATRDRVLQQLRDAGVEETAQPFAKEGVTLPVDDIRGYATELSGKMYRGAYSGDVYRALKHVRDAAEGEVQRVAKSKGQLDVYNRLKSDWSQYMEDFYDTKGPLSKLKNAVNSDSRLNLLSGSEGSRIIDALGRYAGISKASGSAIDAAGRIRSLTRTLRESPSSAKLPTAPERPNFPSPKAPRPMPEPPNLEPFSAQKYRAEHIQKVAQNLSHITGWDVASIGYALRELFTGQPPWALGYPVGKRLLSKLLTNPRVVEYLSKELQ